MEFYTKPGEPASFSGVNKVTKHAKLSQKKVQKYLGDNPTYVRFKPTRKRFPRRKYRVFARHDLLQGDLADVSKLKRFNGGVTFLLVVVDCFSRYVNVEPVKNKSAKTILEAFKLILEKIPQVPKNLMTDRGTEFTNELFTSHCSELGINFYTSQDAATKCSIVERVIKTLKGKLYRYMAANKTKRYIDALGELVSSYNNTYHRSIRMAPSEVNDETEGALRARVFANFIFAPKPAFRYNVGDKVYAAKSRSAFTKGYTPTFNDEVLHVHQHKNTSPPVYKLIDSDNNIISGSFYEQELAHVPRDQ